METLKIVIAAAIVILAVLLALTYIVDGITNPIPAVCDTSRERRNYKNCVSFFRSEWRKLDVDSIPIDFIKKECVEMYCE